MVAFPLGVQIGVWGFLEVGNADGAREYTILYYFSIQFLLHLAVDILVDCGFPVGLAPNKGQSWHLALGTFRVGRSRLLLSSSGLN